MAMNSRRSQSIDEAAKFRLKHQTLLEEFLELQEEFVSLKKKMQIAEKKRDSLLAEVRFLRQKHRLLMELRSSKQEFLPPKKPNEIASKSKKKVKIIKDRATSSKTINQVVKL